MDFTEVLAELRRERDALDAAIRCRERLPQDRLRGRGRPFLLRVNGPCDSTNQIAHRLVNGKASQQARDRQGDLA